MKNRFCQRQFDSFGDNDLAIRIYTSRLLGSDANLVMHGGGNTSVKTTKPDLFGSPVEVLVVKGSGCDLKTIQDSGFSPLRLQPTAALATLDNLSDDDMAHQLRVNLLDNSAPRPSVESILHAILPFKFVDHTHADAVVTLTNLQHGDAIIADIYDDCLVLPYRMPGFDLAKQVFDSLQIDDLQNRKGIILMHHGVVTFADDAKTAYENMIQLVNRSEDYIVKRITDASITTTGRKNKTADASRSLSRETLLRLCQIRKSVCQVKGAAQLAALDTCDFATAFATMGNVADVACRGPITPDHVIHTKRTACIFETNDPLDDSAEELTQSDDDSRFSRNQGSNHHPNNEAEQFAIDYRRYFRDHANDQLTMLDAAPRWGVWKEHGTLAFGNTPADCEIVTDLTEHTIKCIKTAEALDRWQPLGPKDVFRLEYWVLEQRKVVGNTIGSSPAPKIHQGKIAVVTGAASGIGLATARRLHDDGCVVLGLDIDRSVEDLLCSRSLRGVVCDLTDEAAVKSEIENWVRRFGGLDIVVLNAGVFESGETIEGLTDTWTRAIEINLTATQRVLRHCIAFLKHGYEATAIIVGSRNFSAPGAGASAYSVSKAGVTQLARVAALELAKDNVRINTVHPDAVFDTGIWSETVLKQSADRYRMTVEQYKSKNLLRRQITSADVAAMISTVAGPIFASTTGAQIPIDGGNERVI